jgi:hypothetical protein
MQTTAAIIKIAMIIGVLLFLSAFAPQLKQTLSFLDINAHIFIHIKSDLLLNISYPDTAKLICGV